jgi:Neprosin
MRHDKFGPRHRPTAGATLIFAAMLASACVPLAEPSDVDRTAEPAYFDATGNHESPHPHRPDAGKSTPEPTGDVVRVRSDEERARMERYIAGYVKPEDVVTSIKVSESEVIDCVAIARQPALTRSGLGAAGLRLRPPADPQEERAGAPGTRVGDPARGDRIRSAELDYGTKGPLCPEQTVPIRRLTIEILDNFETLEDFFRARPPHMLTGPTDSHQYANSWIAGDNSGAQSTLNVWNPYTERSDEFSLSQIGVERGTEVSKETVEAGWQKFRDLYGDNTPRLFIYFTPDNYGPGGCYNLTCNAFVQVNNSIYIGGGFTNISAHPHPSTAWEFTIRWQRQRETGDWWLKYGDTWVGYYPSRLFDDNGLKPRGNLAQFFGEIVDDQPDGRHTRTDMGSGHFPGDGFAYAAYQRAIRTITTGNVWNIRPALSAGRTDANCYDIDVRESSGSWERYQYLGGPGYNEHCR